MPTDEWVRGFAAGWDSGRYHERYPHHLKGGESKAMRESIDDFTPSPKPKRKASAYSKRYGAAFRKVAPKFKKKNGSWKTNGFKNAQKAAHKLARRK